MLPRFCNLVHVRTLHCKALLQSLAVLCDRSSHAESPLLDFGLRKHLYVWVGSLQIYFQPKHSQSPRVLAGTPLTGKQKATSHLIPSAWPSVLTPLNPDAGHLQRVTHLHCEGSNPRPFGRSRYPSYILTCVYSILVVIVRKFFFASREGSLSEASAQ